jgi:hypothetical protein
MMKTARCSVPISISFNAKVTGSPEIEEGLAIVNFEFAFDAVLSAHAHLILIKAKTIRAGALFSDSYVLVRTCCQLACTKEASTLDFEVMYSDEVPWGRI